MKQLIYCALAIALVFTTSCGKEEKLVDSDNNVVTEEKQSDKRCAFNEDLEQMIELHPEIALNMERINEFTNKVTERGLKNSDEIITIPVVVHVVYNTTEQNISDSQIDSQIEVLNKDYNKENEDVGDVPGVFKKRVANVGIKFELKRVTRTKTNVVEFNDDYSTDVNERFNIARKGTGRFRLDPKKYLNIWVGKFGGGYNGFTLNPASIETYPDLDGVYIDYRVFGTNGTVSSDGAYNLGRTATHEVGHWLNLIHLWGLGNGACDKDDFVKDTPKQNGAWPGCSYPTVSCNTTNMSMNYMGYANDACMYMFSKGQKTRMRATFEPGGIRETFK